MRIIAYAYEADVHCPECTFNQAAVGLLKRVPPLDVRTDAHGLTGDLVDREGNPVTPIYDIDEMPEEQATIACGDCHEILQEREA
jgi:hypothetical protein